ncbi:MAG: methyltransferase family protein [Kiloniellaceae bacterium]
MTQTEDTEDRPGVVARPPLIYLGFLGLGLGLDALWPVAVIPEAVQYPAGAALIALGVGIVAAAFKQFRAAGTNVETSKPTNAIVTGGLYRFSRNPIYLALSSIYAGIGIAADNLWVLALLVPVLAIVRSGVIAREERYLEDKFGADYRRYKAAVRRWL